METAAAAEKEIYFELGWDIDRTRKGLSPTNDVWHGLNLSSNLTLFYSLADRLIEKLLTCHSSYLQCMVCACACHDIRDWCWHNAKAIAMGRYKDSFAAMQRPIAAIASAASAALFWIQLETGERAFMIETDPIMLITSHQDLNFSLSLFHLQNWSVYLYSSRRSTHIILGKSNHSSWLLPKNLPHSPAYLDQHPSPTPPPPSTIRASNAKHSFTRVVYDHAPIKSY